MLEKIAIAVLLLWLAVLMAGYTFGGYLHLLPVVAVIMIVARACDHRDHDQRLR